MGVDRPWEVHKDGIRLRLRVTPRARHNAINGILDASAETGGPALKVSVTAPPADGKANAAVLALLAKALHVPKSSLSVIAGAAGRNKLIHIPSDGPTLIPMLEALVDEEAGSTAPKRGNERAKK
jgi:hypothetical protein